VTICLESEMHLHIDLLLYGEVVPNAKALFRDVLHL
jgi:hypothetical protein